MKADREFGGEGGREADGLRGILREWEVPGPPPEIEDDLRRTFRRRRGWRRPVLWLSVAASVVLLLVYRATPHSRPGPPVVAERASAATPAAPALPPPSPIAARPLETRARAVGELARAHPRAEAAVVEPGQAALLAQLAGELRGKRCASPAGAAPQIVAAPLGSRPEPIPEAPPRDVFLPHHNEWKRIETEWPFVHRSL